MGARGSKQIPRWAWAEECLQLTCARLLQDADISGLVLLRTEIDELRALGVPEVEALRLERHIAVFRTKLPELLAAPSQREASSASSANASALPSASTVVKVRTPRRSLVGPPSSAPTLAKTAPAKLKADPVQHLRDLRPTRLEYTPPVTPGRPEPTADRDEVPTPLRAPSSDGGGSSSGRLEPCRPDGQSAVSAFLRHQSMSAHQRAQAAAELLDFARCASETSRQRHEVLAKQRARQKPDTGKVKGPSKRSTTPAGVKDQKAPPTPVQRRQVFVTDFRAGRPILWTPAESSSRGSSWKLCRAPFTLIDGNCNTSFRLQDCVSSPNFPEPYDNNGACRN
eukprot:s5918_g2.t1